MPSLAKFENIAKIPALMAHVSVVSVDFTNKL